MAITVPTAESQETVKNLPGVRGANIPTDSFGEPFGRVAKEALGSASRLQGIAAKQKNDIDKTMVLNADLGLSRLKTDLEVRRNQLTGRDAADAITGIQEEYRLGAEEISKGLGNDEQKAAFANRVNHHWLGAGGLYESTLKYSDREIRSFTQENYSAGIDLRVNDAIIKSDDKEILDQNLAEIKALTNDHFDDPAVAEKEFNKHKKAIDSGMKELRLESEREAKQIKEEVNLAANNDASALYFDDTLTKNEIDRNKDALGKDYEKWILRHKKRVEQKEKELKTDKKPVYDPIVNADFSSRAMSMPADSTTEDISKLRDDVSDAVATGKLKPEAGRSIIGDAERTLGLDPVRKSSEDNVVGLLKSDYNNGMFGEVGTLEARGEYNRQMTAFRKWGRTNLERDPIEYYEEIMTPVKTKSFFGLIDTMKPQPVKTRKELAGERDIVETRTLKDGRIFVKLSDGTIEEQ